MADTAEALASRPTASSTQSSPLLDGDLSESRQPKSETAWLWSSLNGRLERIDWEE